VEQKRRLSDTTPELLELVSKPNKKWILALVSLGFALLLTLVMGLRLLAPFGYQRVDWLDVKDILPESPPIVLAFEEPELYLHPQAQLAFYEDIRRLKDTSKASAIMIKGAI
jgi:hypothetical protein